MIGDQVSICDKVKLGNNVFIESGVAFVEKLNDRANNNSEAKITVVEDNTRIHSKAVIESGAYIRGDRVVDYGEIVRKELDKEA